MATTLEAGTAVSHYRVIGPLGAGGMGEVYKAHDNHLERVVALKILPPSLVRNDERVRRFMQEAKAASSLNHPHIVTIHEIGEAHDDVNGHPIHYIAMELVDGVTLKRKIHQDDTDLRTLLTYLAQAADGLAKAHAAGIVHRDLKPENIMVTRDGFAKVLDFGLAKLNVKKSSESSVEKTAVRDETREGAVLGTVAYMSPEQVQGKVVDHRSDIFSFGAILYEAAARRRPFEADSDVDVMHKIMHEKPVPVDEITVTVPAELRRLIRRCLAKDPDRRYQSMKDLALELSEIVDEFEELSASASSRTSASLSNPALTAGGPRSSMARAVIVGTVLIAAAAIAFAAWQWREARMRDDAPASFSSMRLTRLTSEGNVARAAISPDGKYVAQAKLDESSRWSLTVRQVVTGSDVQVIPPAAGGIAYPTFSPDGNYVLYSQYAATGGGGYGTLQQVPTLGGAPRKLTFDVDSRVSFSPDGKRMTFIRGEPQVGYNSLMVANADGTGEKLLARWQRLTGPKAPSWSPDGKTIAFAQSLLESGRHDRIAAVDAGSGEIRTIGTRRWSEVGDVAWLPDGSGVVFSGSAADSDRAQIWRQPYPEGEPVRVTNDLSDYDEVSVTADGRTLSVIRVDTKADVMICDVKDSSGGKPFGVGANTQPLEVSVASTGAVVASFANDRGVDIGIIDRPGASVRLLTSDGKSSHPTISSDGKTIAFQSRREGDGPRLFVMDPDGGNVRQLSSAGQGAVRPRISPDGQTVLFLRRDQSLWGMPVAGGQPQKLVDITDQYAISPDSTRVAYRHRARQGDLGSLRVAVMPLKGGPVIVDLPLTSLGYMTWMPKGDGVAYLRPSGGGTNIFLQPLTGGEPVQLTSFKSGVIRSFDWTPDGKLIMVSGEVRSDVVLITDFR